MCVTCGKTPRVRIGRAGIMELGDPSMGLSAFRIEELEAP